MKIELGGRMISRVAFEVIKELKNNHSDLYEITCEEIRKTIDNILIINHNWHGTDKEVEMIFKEVVFKLL